MGVEIIVAPVILICAATIVLIAVYAPCPY